MRNLGYIKLTLEKMHLNMGIQNNKLVLDLAITDFSLSSMKLFRSQE